MALYKTFSYLQKQSNCDTIFNTDFSEYDKDMSDKNIIFDEDTIGFIKDKFAILLYGYPADFFKEISKLLELIVSNPNYCFQYIFPDHIQKLISYISVQDYCMNAIYFLDFILDQYPFISQNDEFFKLSEALFNSMAGFFSVNEINDNINHLKNIIFNSISYATIRDLFIESKCMENLVKHIENYEEEDQVDELLSVSLEIIKFLVQIQPIPEYFEIFIYHLLVISTFSGEESIFSLQILTQITKYSSINVYKHINEYGGLETSYIEDLISFLHKDSQNETKRIASFKFLNALSKYGDPIFKLMIDKSALFEVNQALSDKKDKIIIEAIKFITYWLQNSNEYKFYIIHRICRFDYSKVLENSLYKVKYQFLKLLFNYSESQNSLPNHLTQLVNDDTLIYIVDQLDEADPFLSKDILNFFKNIVVKCQIFPDFIRMIQNELSVLEFNDPLLNEMLFNVLELIKQQNL